MSERIGDRLIKNPIDVLFQLAHGVGTEQRQILPIEMLFSRQALSEHMISVTKAWFESLPLLEPVYDLFAGTILNPGMYLDQSFLGMTQAVESFHRRAEGKEAGASHRPRLARILSGQSDEDREWLTRKLEYSHEPSFRKRLRELIHETPEVLPYIGNEAKFVQDVVVTRNYLTHYDAKLRSDALRHEGMWNAIHRLRGLLTVAILRYLGISSEMIEGVLRGNSRPARYLRLAAERSV